MNELSVLRMVEVIISIGIIFQTIEFLSLQEKFSEQGIWRWSQIRDENPNLIYFNFLLSEKNFNLLLWLRLLGALIFIAHSTFIIALILFMSSLLISLRFRGSFNGGSDYMAQIILSALCIATLFPSKIVITGALWYISLQVCTSYFIAGIVKLKQKNWRTGKAMRDFINSPNYDPPQMIKKILDIKKIAFISAWLVMIFELTFPFILMLHGKYVLIGLCVAFLFHLTNVFIFGLNRFLIVWTATFPAIYFVANIFSNSP